jgi:hypothetical protein
MAGSLFRAASSTIRGRLVLLTAPAAVESPFGPFSDHRGEGRPNLIRTTRFNRPKCQSQRGSRAAQLFQLDRNGWFGWVKQVCHPGDSGKSLFKQFQAFAAQLTCKGAQTRDVSTWSKAFHKPCGHEIPRGDVNNRNRFYLFGTLRPAAPNHDVNLESHHVGSDSQRAFSFTFGPPVLDDDIISLDPAKLTQTLPQSVCPVRDSISAGALSYKTNAGDFLRLLRLGGKTKCKEHSD